MKRKLTLAFVAVSAVGGAWSCFSMGQDPFGGAQAPANTVRTVVGRYGDPALYPTALPGVDVDMATTVSGVTFSGESALAKNVSTIAKQLKSAEGAEKESIAQKLKVAVGEQFDFRHMGKAKELKSLEEQLAKLKEIHNKRTQQRDRIISDRVQQILLEVESLGWGLSDASDPTNLYTTSSGWDVSAPRGFAARNGFLAPAAAPTTSTAPARIAPTVIAPTSATSPERAP